MSCDLLQKWLAHYDPIHFGYTVAGIANGVCATGGWSFPRVRGGYNLYRGTAGGASIDFENPVGACGAGRTVIENFSWRPHAAGTRYAYVVKSIGGGGVESAASHPARTAEFDEAGALVGLRPNSPRDLTVRAMSGGRFKLRWLYPSRFEEAAPATFELYHDNGTGVVDYDTVIGSVTYRAGKVHYVFASGAFGHDVRRIWGVRAVSAEGVDDGNEATAFAWSRAQAPGAHPMVKADCLPEED